MKAIQRSWQGWHPITLLLLPLSGLFCLLVALRRLAYRLGLIKAKQLSVPVIVVGNITVGGTGKTPLVIWLAGQLRRMGYKPGIITRGYGGLSDIWPCEVTENSKATAVGDEAVLMQRRAKCPVFAGPNRWEAGNALLSAHDCDFIISDDGLQHYALQRDLEIVVIDGDRRFGNGLCLPAGPMRERPRRLNKADLVIVNGNGEEDEYSMQVGGELAVRLDGSEERTLTSFSDEKICAIAGIGHPGRFFSMLQQAGLSAECYPFPDHHPFRVEELQALPQETVLMTEKDGVKCELFAQPDYWYVPATAKPDSGFQLAFDTMVKRLNDG
ncbi:MAG: tetraacyldisaccharide 4'-kinase [Candidatus Thiodiazotropha sp. (ex Myrtea sp. 'scaly one' KF741663)]|nr:tetraacyldisaccharide 4'-kinase [Candidatus Thiodiazotropha sp. (ex Myrtea sp. 'scaly one' KF741663)]